MVFFDRVIAAITNALNIIMSNNFTDIIKVHLYSHYLESIIVTLQNAKLIYLYDEGNKDDYSNILNKMHNLGLLSEDIICFYQSYEQVIIDTLPLEELVRSCNPVYIHEELLNRDLCISESSVQFDPGKVYRDTSGSYYTPSDLAYEVVREAIDKFLKSNSTRSYQEAIELLSKVKIADLSCGCGEFIKAVRLYLSEKYDIHPEIIGMNLYGIDIDPIALQITICDLLSVVNKSKWNTIINHFILGNPLINQPKEESISVKTTLYATKRYYAPGMGLDVSHILDNIKFDLIIGNPPWEKIRFEERKFFKTIVPEISSISQKNKRQASIDKLSLTATACYEWYKLISDDYITFKTNVVNHPCLNASLCGEYNTYALFSELSLIMLSDSGTMSLIVKSAISTSPVNAKLFNMLLNEKYLASICLCENTCRIFSVDSREKFCVLTCIRKHNETFELLAGVTKIEDLHTLKRSKISCEDIKVINPQTMMLPNISKNRDFDILHKFHKKLPIFRKVYPDCHFGRLVHLTAHAKYIGTVQTDENVPIYEGKFIERYDARFTTFAGLGNLQKYANKAHAYKNKVSYDGRALPESRYFINKEYWDNLSSKYTEPYMLCWRSLTSPTNSRTTLAMILPKMPTCQSIQLLQINDKRKLLLLLALFNSKPFDYFVRLKMPGLDLTQSVINQIPVPHLETYRQQIEYAGVSQNLEQHIIDRTAMILSKEPLVFSMLDELGLLVTDTQSSSQSFYEFELDDLFYIAYGLNNSEINAIKMNFKK